MPFILMGAVYMKECILVVEDDESVCNAISELVRGNGFTVITANSVHEGLKLFASHDIAVILSDLNLPGNSGLEFLKVSLVVDRSIPVVVMTAFATVNVAVEAMKLGAADFITKPFDPSSLEEVLQRAFAKRQATLKRLAGNKRNQRGTLITQNPLFDKVLVQAKKVAPLATPVMILGESGTGKELLARFIHENSSCASGPFIAVNCGATPGTLLESEFFGHEAGAFTGATEKRIGLFEEADGGTIFLDEVGEMPPMLQVKLLRTLQDGEIRPLGSTHSKKVNIRIISATNSDIEANCKNGLFRPDLYYRLGVVTLALPSLKERREDIPLLANYFAKTIADELSVPAGKITPEAMRMLTQHSWPGNVRELENTIERAMIFAEGALTPECFSLSTTTGHCGGPFSLDTRSLSEIAAIALRSVEIEAILRALEEAGGNKTRAAKGLGVSYKTLLNKCREYSL